jgi:hypothetical protein
MLENNRLIAEFMQLEPSVEVMGSSKLYYKIKGYQRHDSLIASEDEFEYHLSFDWLMPVIEKIEGQGTIVEIWLCLAKSCRITTTGFKKPTIRIANTESNSLIDAVYEAVIEYIKWYNQNK